MTELIGVSVPRLEDRTLLLGQGRFAADINFPGQLHMRVVRSAVPHGRILTIDSAAALASEGTAAVWTGADVAAIPPIDFRQVKVMGLEPYRQPILAQGVVRYVGEPVAVVFADDPYRAEDAAERVFVDYEELQPVLVSTAAPRAFAPGQSTEPAVITKTYGDLEAAFATAYQVVELLLSVGRHSGVPLETRGAIAYPNSATGILEIHGAAKIPHINRRFIAAMLNLEEERLHLYEGHVGGGFGVRGELYPEDVLVALAALRLKRPVKWIEDRREHLIAANHSRDQTNRVRAAIDREGRIIGLESDFWIDQGAYVRTHAATLPDLSAALLPGPYVVPAYRASGRMRLTNKTPAGTYRAPGRYETTFVRERMIDAIAHRIRCDPDAVRRVNFISKERMPFARELDALGTDVVYDSGDYARLLDRYHAHFGISAITGQCRQRRANGECVGYGHAMFVEKSGLGPFDGVRVTVESDGSIEVVTGVASVGQGVETVIAQITAETLGVPLAVIRVVHGQTDRITDGRGAFASRVTAMTGPAAALAAGELKQRLLALAAGDLQQKPADLRIADGRVIVRGRSAGPSLTLADLARLAGGSIAQEHWFKTSHMNYPYGVHGVVARVDAETGTVAVDRILIAYDVGRAVNPMLVEGQLAGGAAQGLGGALLEEFRYDDNGQPLSTSLADYLLPTCVEVPPIAMLLTEDAPSPVNPLGVKGAGEGGITAMGAAIASAIDDALQISGAVTSLPIKPEHLRRLAAARVCAVA